MQRSIATLSALILVGLTAFAWAGPAEEVAQLSAPRGQAFEDGNLDAWMAAFADNAVLQAFMSPYRIEGKEAIRAHYAELFHMYPRRRGFVRQPAVRVYNDDLVVQNAYSVASFTDQRGQTTLSPIRYSVVWAKTGGRWQIVDLHVSRLPATP
jgi:uncharacterized protein (TIGR02246 family)